MRQNKTYKCSQCHKLVNHLSPNKIMMKCLTEYFLYECPDCNLAWTLDTFRTHKLQGKCRPDPTAANNVNMIKKQAQKDRDTRLSTKQVIPQ